MFGTLPFPGINKTGPELLCHEGWLYTNGNACEWMRSSRCMPRWAEGRPHPHEMVSGWYISPRNGGDEELGFIRTRAGP